MTYTYDDMDKVLDTFQWAYQSREYNRGEVTLNRETGRLELVIFVSDNDDLEGLDKETIPLVAGADFNPWKNPAVQVRELIHWFICHEADEQLWFDREQIFYPHNEDGSLR